MNDSQKVAAIRALLNSFVTRGTHDGGETWITVEDHHYYDDRFLDDLFAVLDDDDAEAGGAPPVESITVEEDLGGPFPRRKRIVLDLHPDGSVRWRRSKFDTYYDGNAEALKREASEPSVTEQVARGFIPFRGDERG